MDFLFGGCDFILSDITSSKLFTAADTVLCLNLYKQPWEIDEKIEVRSEDVLLMIAQLINNKTGFGPKKGFSSDMFLTSTFLLTKEVAMRKLKDHGFCGCNSHLTSLLAP